MSSTKIHKLYFPGLISLVCLPAMCIYYLMNYPPFHKFQALQFNWSTKAELNRHININGKKCNVETFRRYKTMMLSGNLKNDSIQLEALSNTLIKLVADNDTINGIKIYIGDHVTYQEYVNLLDVYEQSPVRDQLWFAPTEDELFAGYSNNHFRRLSMPR